MGIDGIPGALVLKLNHFIRVGFNNFDIMGKTKEKKSKKGGKKDKDATGKALKKAEKELKKAEKDLKKAAKKLKDAHAQFEKLKQKIDKKEEKIVAQKSQIDSLKEESSQASKKVKTADETDSATAGSDGLSTSLNVKMAVKKLQDMKEKAEVEAYIKNEDRSTVIKAAERKMRTFDNIVA